MDNYAIELLHITKVFPGIVANDDITLRVRYGEIHALLGENGAGKSTLMSVLFGLYQPEEGEILVNGKKAEIKNPRTANALGIGMVHQHFMLVQNFTVLENIVLGVETAKHGVLQMEEARKKVLALSERYGLNIDCDARVSDITVGMQQRVEILKMLYKDNNILIFDEPTAVLTPQEIDELMIIMQNLKREGKAIIFITHKLNEIKAVSDYCTVLRRGKCIGTCDVSTASVEDLSEMMVGRKIQGTYLNEECQDFSDKPVFFEVKNISRKDQKVKNVSFQLHKGEILGFAGLVGSGRSELMNAIFGAEPKSEGQIFMEGKELKIRNPYEAIQNGLGMVTENRRETGFLDNFDIKQNISIAPFIKTSKGSGVIGLLNNKAELDYANQQCADIRVKCRDIHQNITELSGGNQQKVILGKWMAAESKLIIFDEPTKGIDVGSKSEIYVLMRKLANEGKGVLVVSSELPELLSVCDTIAVFREGEIRGIFRNSEATEEKIVKTSTGE